jgi:hypothetical protein
MQLTVSIKEKNKIATFLSIINDMDYVEIVNIKEMDEIQIEHRDLLDKRLHKIEKGESSFKSWDLIKKKYEEKAV